jgi:AcrR family transcriptional regulator
MQVRKEQRRERVLEAALEVVSERGLASTRMSDISERAAMSSGHVLYYFKTKEALLMEALRFIEARVYEAADAELPGLPPGAARLRRLLELNLPEARGDPRWMLWLEAWALAPHDEPIARLIAELDRRWVDRLGATVHEGIEAGAFACEDEGGFAYRFSAMFDGLAVQVVTGAERGKQQALRTCMLAAARELGFKVDD